MAKRQHHGIRFPFNVRNDYENTFLDLNQTEADDIRSQIMHIIFTPVGQRLRNPMFGSKLIQFLFNPDDSQTWGDVVMEIKDSIGRYVPNCKLDNIEILEMDGGLTLVAKIRYSVTENGETRTYEVATKL